MKPAERDDLLIRLDERTCNIWVLTERQEKHLAELNNSVAKNTQRLTAVETKVDERTNSSSQIRLSKKAKGVGVVGIIGVVMMATLEIGQAIGWW